MSSNRDGDVKLGFDRRTGGGCLPQKALFFLAKFSTFYVHCPRSLAAVAKIKGKKMCRIKHHHTPEADENQVIIFELGMFQKSDILPLPLLYS